MAIPRNLANLAPKLSTTGGSFATTIGVGAATPAASGAGITFPNTWPTHASSDANTLDDYEEGTWTPTYGSSDGTIVLTYALQIGFYTKVGNIVKAAFEIVASSAVSAGPTSGFLQVRGLPFTSKDNSGNYVDSVAIGNLDGFTAYGTSTAQMTGLVQPNGTYIYFFNVSNAVQTTGPTPAALKNGSEIRATLVYTVG